MPDMLLDNGTIDQDIVKKHNKEPRARNEVNMVICVQSDQQAFYYLEKAVDQVRNPMEGVFLP